MPGLAKDRADIIVPGVLILRTVFGILQGDRYVVSGAGLRDGILRDLMAPHRPASPTALEDSIRNFIHFGPPVPEKKLKRIHQDATVIYEALDGDTPNQQIQESCIPPACFMAQENRSIISVIPSTRRIGL